MFFAYHCRSRTPLGRGGYTRTLWDIRDIWGVQSKWYLEQHFFLNKPIATSPLIDITLLSAYPSSTLLSFAMWASPPPPSKPQLFVTYIDGWLLVINNTTNLSEGLPVINDKTDLSERLLVINDTIDLSEGSPVIKNTQSVQ